MTTTKSKAPEVVTVAEYLAQIGSRGGKAARGAAKRRPPAHYARLAAESKDRAAARRISAKHKHKTQHAINKTQIQTGGKKPRRG